MMEKSNSSGVREVGKVPYTYIHLSGYKYMGLWQRLLHAHQIPFLYLGGIDLDYLSKPSLQVGDIMSLNSGL